MDPLFMLRAAITLNMVVFGVHQFVRPGAWTRYIPQFVRRFLPTSDELFMQFHALGNVILGLLLISGFYFSVVGWIVVIWYASIVLSALSEDWAIAVRDFVIMIAALVVILLS